MIESADCPRGRKKLGEAKKTNLVQLRYSDEEHAQLENFVETTGFRDIPTVVRRATQDYTTKFVETKIKGKSVMLTLGEARELLKDLAAKVY